MTEKGRNKRGADDRAARLEAELRANLKKRKEQARVRAAKSADQNCGSAGQREEDDE